MKTIAPAEFSHFVDDWHFLPIVDTGEFVCLSGVAGELRQSRSQRLSGDRELQSRLCQVLRREI